MGMFDYFTCEMPLPEGTPDLKWQTKSLNCSMAYYAVRADGQLVDEQIRMEPKPGTPTAPEFLSNDYLPWYREWWEEKRGPDDPVNHTGEIRFYSIDKTTKQWWEFCAFVEGGRCFKIVQIEPAPTQS